MISFKYNYKFFRFLDPKKIHHNRIIEFFIIFFDEYFFSLNKFIIQPFLNTLSFLINIVISLFLFILKLVLQFLFKININFKITTGFVAYSLYKFFNHYILWLCSLIVFINFFFLSIIASKKNLYFLKFFDYYWDLLDKNILLTEYKFNLFIKYYFFNYFFNYFYISYYIFMYLFSFFLFYHLLDSTKHIIKDYVKLFDVRLNNMLVSVNYFFLFYLFYFKAFTTTNLDSFYYWLFSFYHYYFSIYYSISFLALIFLTFFINKLKNTQAKLINFFTIWLNIKSFFCTLLSYYLIFRYISLFFSFCLGFNLKIYNFFSLYIIYYVIFTGLFYNFVSFYNYLLIFPKNLWRFFSSYFDQSSVIIIVFKFVLFIFITTFHKIFGFLIWTKLNIALFYKFYFFKLLKFFLLSYTNILFIYNYFHYLIRFFFDYLYDLFCYFSYLSAYFGSFILNSFYLYVFDLFFYYIPVIIKHIILMLYFFLF